MENSSALTLSKVCARFADEPRSHAPAISEITFTIPKGAFFSIAGPSGAGKSTLLRAILGLMPISSGTIVRGYERAAMVFQSHALFPWLTALENTAFGLKMQGVKRAEYERVAREKLKEVGLERFESHFPVALSGGQRQRVGLARALAQNPDFLVMDEPFSSLDTITAQELKADIMRLWRKYGMTILMVNHLIPDAVELSDEILILAGRPGEIKKSYPIDLPRPRVTRSDAFYKHVDQLTEELRKVS